MPIEDKAGSKARRATAAANKAADQLEFELVRFRGEEAEIDFNFDISHETVWATQAQIAELFGRDRDTIGHHIENIYSEGELSRGATTAKFPVVRNEGGRQVSRQIEHYNLDAILSVGYRVSSAKATAFRQWANRVLRAYLVDGFALNETVLLRRKEKLEALAEKVRELRANERTVYEQVRDCFVLMSVDYDAGSEESRNFFATLQNKFLYAATRQIASQIILRRADAKKEKMGLRTVKGSVPTLAEAQIAKNYLDHDELYVLHLISEQFMLFAQSAAIRGKKLTMEDLSEKFDKLLATAEYPIFPGYKAALRDRAMDHARRELEGYRVRVALEMTKKRIASERHPPPP